MSEERMNPIEELSTRQIMEELERRFPKGYVFFGVAPPTEDEDLIHVFAEWKSFEELVLLAGYSTIFFAQKSRGFFDGGTSGDEEETDR